MGSLRRTDKLGSEYLDYRKMLALLCNYFQKEQLEIKHLKIKVILSGRLP